VLDEVAVEHVPLTSFFGSLPIIYHFVIARPHLCHVCDCLDQAVHYHIPGHKIYGFISDPARGNLQSKELH
jgi:hypothetical protein